MRPRILLTGFKPFGSLEINPTERLMQAIAAGPGSASGEGFPDALVETLVLDTDYVLCEQQLCAAVQRLAPHAILSFGVNAGTDELRLERIAVNVDEAGLPDSGGHLRAGERIVKEGPVGYWATLALDRVYEALVEAGIPVRFSNHAGTYVCNHLFYYGLHLTQALGAGTTMGFVHVPPFPEQIGEGSRAKVGRDLEALVEAARVCVGTIARDLVCPQPVSGL
jgi:pyroglutamyl-peptidase